MTNEILIQLIQANKTLVTMDGHILMLELLLMGLIIIIPIIRK